jgi:hypothetical protein
MAFADARMHRLLHRDQRQVRNMYACRRALITCTRQTAPCGGKDRPLCSRVAVGQGLDGASNLLRPHFFEN